MSRLITISILFCLLTAVNVSAQESKIVCGRTFYTYGNVAQYTEGQNPHIKQDYTSRTLRVVQEEPPKSRGVQLCRINFLNLQNTNVHVYVDSVYAGTLPANAAGVIETRTDYSNVYCLRDDGKKEWFEKGNCECRYSFQLRDK